MRDREQRELAVPMDDDAEEDNEKNSSRSSSISSSNNGQNEPEIDVTNVSNSCDLSRHSGDENGTATDLRKYD